MERPSRSLAGEREHRKNERKRAAEMLKMLQDNRARLERRAEAVRQHISAGVRAAREDADRVAARYRMPDDEKGYINVFGRRVLYVCHY